MLYIFHVDTGTMMTFDMNLALESVLHLQSVIDNTWRIPRDKQVLLVSGGESLDPNARVCSYSAGTDTNPIYLFSKSIIESLNPPTPSIDCGSDFDLKEQVDASLNMPATYSTVVARARLAQQFCELAREQIKVCEKLVHDQHLQQQGWAAVVANLEDITSEFKARSDKFQISFSQYLDMRTSYLEFLQSFNEDLTTLSKIPMLPALKIETELNSRSQVCERINCVDDSDSPTEETEKCDKVVTLLQWISAADNQSSLDQVAEQCSRGLQQLDSSVIESLSTDVNTALDAANNGQMKEVKGLGDRLYGLEQLMCESKRYVQEQSDLAQAFLQNQNRASNLGDTSILPDLCASHRKQLLVMLSNHQKLRDIRRRCTRAKEELIVNLYHRLKWIMYVENLILETDHKLMIYHESLKRLRRHVEIIQQIHLAPSMYLNAVAEVVRRRSFSQAFLLWASELACHILTIHSDEVTRRKDFQIQFEGHFLNSLFPGMDDLPPSFATQAPSIFDSSLPKLTSEDIEKLKTELPELAQNISVPDVSASTQYFFQKSSSKEDKVDERNVEEKLVQAVTDVGLASNLDRGLLKPIENDNFLSTHATLPHLKDFDKGFESETDTEEFEKVGQSPLELQFDAKNTISPRPGMNDASTITEENLSSSKMESEKLKTFVLKMAALAKEAMNQLRIELNELRIKVQAEQFLISSHCMSLSSSWDKMIGESEIKERESLQRLTIDHELEQSDLKKLIQCKGEEIQSLRKENQCLEKSLDMLKEENIIQKDEYERLLQHCTNECIELKKRIEESTEEKEKAVKEMKDMLTKEYKAEMDSIRSRFKLMSFMERSPSDSSLEKIDPNVIDIAKHNLVLQQLKDDFLNKKEKAVNEALAAERVMWESKLEQDMTQCKIRNEAEKQVLFNEAMKRVVEEKDRIIDRLREHEVALNSECQSYKSTIQKLTDQDNESIYPSLVDEVERLQRENAQLELELCMKTSRHFIEASSDLTTSVSVYLGKIDACTSPIKMMDKLTSSQTSLIQAGKINIASCNAGDPVLVMWNSVYQNFVVLQESRVLYFLHPDCLETLNLKLQPDDSTRKSYSTAEVIDKEYCHARKDGNRYMVPKGTKFYRVRVKQLPKFKDLIRSQQQHHRKSSQLTTSTLMTQSQTTEQTTSVLCASSVTESQSVPTSPTKSEACTETSLSVHPDWVV